MENYLLGVVCISSIILGYMLDEFVRYIKWKKIEEEKEDGSQIRGIF